MSNSSTSTSRLSRYRGQALKRFSQMWWKMLILTSIKLNRFRCWGRKSKRVISRNVDCRRRWNIETQRWDLRGNRLMRLSMSLRAVQSPVRSFELLSCGACALRGIQRGFGPF